MATASISPHVPLNEAATTFVQLEGARLTDQSEQQRLRRNEIGRCLIAEIYI